MPRRARGPGCKRAAARRDKKLWRQTRADRGEMPHSGDQRQRRKSALEEGMGGRNLLKVSPPLAQTRKNLKKRHRIKQTMRGAQAHTQPLAKQGKTGPGILLPRQKPTQGPTRRSPRIP